MPLLANATVSVTRSGSMVATNVPLRVWPADLKAEPLGVLVEQPSYRFMADSATPMLPGDVISGYNPLNESPAPAWMIRQLIQRGDPLGHLAGTMAPGLTDTAVVYTKDSHTGQFTVVSIASLACRLVQQLPQRPMPGAVPRMEDIPHRWLAYDASVTLPESACQILLGGVRYNPVAGTIVAQRGASGNSEFLRIDVRRAQ